VNNRTDDQASDHPEPVDDGDAIAERVPEELLEIVGDPDKAREVLRFTEAWFWQGPLPPPGVLAAYNDAYPGCAEHVVKMAMDQSDHRRDLEATTIKGDLRLRQVGQIFAFIIAMTVIVGGLILIATGRPVYGLVSVLTVLTGLAALFVYSRNAAEDELEDKRAALEPPTDGPSDSAGPGGEPNTTDASGASTTRPADERT
jgi:uncharacterized membrane protein